MPALPLTQAGSIFPAPTWPHKFQLPYLDRHYLNLWLMKLTSVGTWALQLVIVAASVISLNGN